VISLVRTDADGAGEHRNPPNFDYVTNSVHWDQTVSNQTLPNSLYLSQKPAFFNAASGYTWPWRG
jgi:hypothetical protein